MVLNQLRDELQEKWASEFMKEGIGLLHLCPRSGKIRTSIRIFCKVQRIIKRRPKILVTYPDKNIKQSWEDDIISVKYKNPDIEYVTHVSLSKVIKNKYDIIVCDEIHLLSPRQRANFKSLMKTNENNAYVVCLSGTLSSTTKTELRKELRLKVISEYSLDEAVRDHLVSDYRIHVVSVKLDNITIVDKKKSRTEKQMYDAYTWVIENKGPSLFLNLGRMGIINNSIAKLNKTKDVLHKLSKERVLVFAPNNKVAKALGCKIHTAKFNNQAEFEKFIKNNSGHNHYAVCKIGNTGVSFKKLDNIVVNAFDSNSENLAQRICRSLILDEENKISDIYIITSTEKTELKWLKKALEFFNPKKINYDSQLTQIIKNKTNATKREKTGSGYTHVYQVA